MPDFIALDDIKSDEIAELVARGCSLKRAWDARRMPNSLAGKRIALVNDDGGWRNTTAFNLGISAMGGLCVPVPIKLNARETTEDLGSYLDNWFDAVVIRSPLLKSLRDLARAASAPVINARTRSNHPCETLGDLCYLSDIGVSLDGLNVVAVAADDNILRSWIEAAAVLPITVTQVYPERWHARSASNPTSRFQATTDVQALRLADVIITDCWPQGANADELLGYQVTSALLATAKSNVVFLPCPPVKRGEEVSEEAMTSPQMRSVHAKEYLLHAQNAVLEWSLNSAA